MQQRYRLQVLNELGKDYGSVVDPKLFFPDPDPTLTLISDPDRIRFRLVYEKYIRNFDHLNIATKPDC